LPPAHLTKGAAAGVLDDRAWRSRIQFPWMAQFYLTFARTYIYSTVYLK
jgi:hypothetical protein